ncbi:Glutathione S-transferase 3 [Vanrija pseudolonga]|uniref:Glutathione S-transferase 3 n=1 Tax=Vanrija pseudolonga TaxID=143232 RepID=A0AAF0YG21_9TREE|nr:Glutathione S-transferase 3 [Vanrija pseudolonga]
MPSKPLLHYLHPSRGERIVWLLEELGVDYDLSVHLRARSGWAEKTLNEVSSLGKSPALEIDGKLLTESGFITYYLLKHFSSPNVEASPSDASVFWSHFAEGTLLLWSQPTVVLGGGARAFAKNESTKAGALALAGWYTSEAGRTIAPALQQAEEFLGEHEWFSGGDKPGQGDFMMGYALDQLARGGQLPIGPKTKAYIAKMKARPAFVRGMARATAAAGERGGTRAPLLTHIAMAKLTLHYLHPSRGERIVWLLEELGLEYELVTHLRTEQGWAGESLKAISPMGKSPVLEVDGKKLTESGYITHYLLTRHSSPSAEAPPGDDSVFWAHYAEGTLQLWLQPAFMVAKGVEGFKKVAWYKMLPGMKMGAGAFGGWFAGVADTNIAAALGEVEEYLVANEWFSGTDKPGQGDFMMGYSLDALVNGNRKGQYDVGPATRAWVARMRARDAYKRGQERIAAGVAAAEKEQKA